MPYVIEQPDIVVLPVRGQTGTFPVRRIWCIGRNYAEHAREMGHDPDREEPFFFAKPASAIASGDGELPFPDHTTDLHHEVELVAAIGRSGKCLSVEAAQDIIYGYAVGFDMTLRDRQAQAKKLGRPWDLAKGFDRSCPISEIVPATSIGHPVEGRIEALVNDRVQQSGDLNQMIWSTVEALAYLSQYVEILPGDLLMTGTPAGVSAVKTGDCLVGRCASIGEIKIRYI